MTTSNSSAVFNPQEEIAKQTTIHTNLKQDIFFSTKDKLLLMLRHFKDAIEYKQQIATYGSIALTLLITLVTSETKQALGLSADVWKAVFIIAFITSVGLTIHSIYNVYKTQDECDINIVCQKIMSGDKTGSLKNNDKED